MAEVKRRVRPVPLPPEVYLDNPHRGCCTFQHFSGDQLAVGLAGGAGRRMNSFGDLNDGWVDVGGIEIR